MDTRTRWLSLVLLAACACMSSPGANGVDDAGPDAGLLGADASQLVPEDAGILLDATQADAAHPQDASSDDAALPPDAATLPDASATPDAAPGLDASSLDAAVESLEDCCARLGCQDTTTTLECMQHPSMWGTCAVSGVPGTCMDVGSCGGDLVNTAGFCPGPANIQCCHPAVTGVDGGQMCTGQEHPLPNEGIAELVLDARCAPGMVLAGTVCVDAFEGFVEELLPDGGTTGWSPYFNPGTRSMVARSAQGAVPQGYINANQAEAACNNAGKRLCSDVEWLRACQGASMFTYPYGNMREPGVCNDARSVHPAIEYFGASDPDPFSKIGHPCLNQLANGLDPTGANAQCVSPDGPKDMMGNLHEWTSDPAGTFRGGFYVDTRINGNGCLYKTTAHDRSHWDYSTGFRCCAAPL